VSPQSPRERDAVPTTPTSPAVRASANVPDGRVHLSPADVRRDGRLRPALYVMAAAALSFCALTCGVPAVARRKERLKTLRLVKRLAQARAGKARARARGGKAAGLAATLDSTRPTGECTVLTSPE